MATHSSLACLCMSYLLVLSTSQDQSTITLQQHLHDGLYAFLDYASACWAIHLQSSFAKPKSQKQPHDLDSITEAVETFVELCWCTTSKPMAIPNGLRELLQPLSGSNHFEQTLQAIVWANRQRGVKSQPPSTDEALDVWQLVQVIRTVLENETTVDLTDTEALTLKSHYGERWFKCPRTSCSHYHEGFVTPDERNAHVRKHDRPYICEVIGCYQTTFGFSSKSELTKHLLHQHGIDVSCGTEYPIVSNSTRKAEEPEEASTFSCPTCGKSFQWRHTLTAHLKIHENRKPFVCKTCGDSFARVYDLQRHEDVHGEKRYRCHGQLMDGSTWGCGASFSRRDKRKEHFNTKTGLQCILPLVKQKLREDSRQSNRPSHRVDTLICDGEGILHSFSRFVNQHGLRLDE